MTKELLEQIHKWQKETFIEANAVSKLHHLKKELNELMSEVELETDDSAEEYADCFLLLYGSAMAYGMSYEDILYAIEAKFNKNKARKWGKPDENGVVEHIKE